jgi:FdhD protein
MEATLRFGFRRYEAGASRVVEADVIAEATVALAVNGKPWLSFSCTPLDIEALAAGFLYNECVISSREEIGLVEVCREGHMVDVWLTHEVEKPLHWQRTSGCMGGFTSGGPGGGSEVSYSINDGGLIMSPEDVAGLVASLSESQQLYRTAGGVHTSLLADRSRIVLGVEDIGRHNTFDKIAGRCLLEGIAVSHRVMATTGRISSDMLQKAARFGAAMVVSQTSPTARSVELAEHWGMTLIGYARPHRFDVYTHPERIS